MIRGRRTGFRGVYLYNNILLYRSCPMMSTSCTKTWSADQGSGGSEETIYITGWPPYPSSILTIVQRSNGFDRRAKYIIMYPYDIVIYNRRFPRNDQCSEFFIVGKHDNRRYVRQGCVPLKTIFYRPRE